jgi:hypothetical protein
MMHTFPTGIWCSCIVYKQTAQTMQLQTNGNQKLIQDHAFLIPKCVTLPAIPTSTTKTVL